MVVIDNNGCCASNNLDNGNQIIQPNKVSELEQYIGKTCKIHIKVSDKNLFYTAVIHSTTPDHIHFIDRFNKNFTFRISDVTEIEELTLNEVEAMTHGRNTNTKH